MLSPSSTPSEHEAQQREFVRTWLTARLAKHLKVAPSAIDPNTDFDEFGLDSQLTLKISGELEKLLRREVSPAILIEMRTIEQVAQAVTAPTSGAGT